MLSKNLDLVQNNKCCLQIPVLYFLFEHFVFFFLTTVPVDHDLPEGVARPGVKFSILY
jgi:hypothetical protein